jgi:membrane-associated phospholipid phosphatase
MIDFFKKHSFVIGTFSLGIGFLLEYLSQSKWLILPFVVIALLGGIAQVYIGLNKKQ